MAEGKRPILSLPRVVTAAVPGAPRARPAVVPRDTNATRSGVLLRSKPATAPAPGAPSDAGQLVTSEWVNTWERERSVWQTPKLDAAMLDARLYGRHGGERSMVLDPVHPAWFSADEKALVMGAFDEGRRARALGTPCLCIDCCNAVREFPQAERIAYRSRRYAELMLKGLDHDAASAVIAAELAGAPT